MGRFESNGPTLIEKLVVGSSLWFVPHPQQHVMGPRRNCQSWPNHANTKLGMRNALSRPRVEKPAAEVASQDRQGELLTMLGSQLPL